MRNRLLIAASILVVVAVGAFLAFKFAWGGNAPEEASLSTDAPVTSGEFAGNWKVDTASGEFDRSTETYTSTYAGYRIDEELVGIGANTAVGRTRDVQGTMTTDERSVTSASVTVDMTTLESDQDRRDDAVQRRGLETGRFPTATFELSKPISFGKEPKPGDRIETDAAGNFTLHGDTQAITVPIEARWTGDRITVVSKFDVVLADYGIEKPVIPGRVILIKDTGTVELQLHFTKA